MNMIKKTLLATVLVTCAASAFAAPNGEHKPEHHGKQCSEMMPPPPPQPPVYAVIQQSETPKETLSSAIQNVPAPEKGKRYEVRVEVKELPPAPPAPAKAPPAQ